jgi:hypothetical protein
MAVDPQVVVNIASEFTGKKAFDEAGKSTSKLDKNIKNLAKSLLAAFSVRAIVNFGKESVKAFQDAEKEAAQLRTQLDSLNLGFAAPFIGQFIDKLALATGKAGGDLNDAFITLSQGTQNVTDAQKLLNVALDVSAGTSKDLKTVTTALQRAYLGDVNALARLRIGYTTANLAGRDFDEVLTEITEKFKGSSSQAAETLAGKMARLSEATEQAKEAFGAGFVKGLEKSGAAVEDLQKDVISLGDAFGYAAGQATGFFSQTFNDLIKYFETDQGAIAQFARSLIKSQGEVNRKNEKANSAALRARNAILKIEAKNLATLKNTTKEKEKQAKLDKAALALGKGENIFDLDQIQIQAAILSTQENIIKLGANATDQQKLQLANDAQRLTVKQLILELEDAIAAKDVKRATSLSEQLNKELAILGTLTGQTYKLSQIDKILDNFVPKDLINLSNLDAALAKLLAIAGTRFDFLSPIMLSEDRTGINELAPDITSRYVAGDPEAIKAVEAHADAISMLAESELALAQALFEESARALDIATASVSPSVLPSFGGFDPARFRMADNITVNVNAGVVGNEDTISLAVQRAILDLERKGDPLRYTGGL